MFAISFEFFLEKYRFYIISYNLKMERRKYSEIFDQDLLARDMIL